MGKINILPDDLINIISAGEVVERPASVVKELVENSIDAGASKITIELQKAGKRLIRITDDGSGMSDDDAFLAIERHATSKVRNKSDVFNIRTLGFRGEAIPSIAAVSRFTLISKEQGSANPALKIYCEAGKIVNTEYIQYGSGTSIEVRSLFYNVPARKKQLRTDNTELMHILEMTNRLALSNPAIAFHIIHNEREIVKYLARKRLIERLMDVFSLEFSKSAIELKYADDYISISGYVSKPQEARKDWNQQYVFVNGRYVSSRIIRHALDSAYDTLLPRNRYPKGVIFLKLAPLEVDVNVHPTKIQVRFNDANRVHDALAHVIRDTLLQKNIFADNAEPEGYIPTASFPKAPEGNSFTQAPTPMQQEITGAISKFYEKQAKNEEMPSFERRFIQSHSTSVAQSRSAESEQPNITQILGQALNTYIICATTTGFLLIDQHAAHERIRYERLYKAYSTAAIEAQELLVPISVEIGPREKLVISKMQEELEKVGFRIEDFGNNIFNIVSVPAMIKDQDVKGLFYEILDEYITGLKGRGLKERMDAVVKLISCKGAIKANHKLRVEEMRGLIDELYSCDSPFTCPHGRPTLIMFDKYQIEKMFKRVM